ncbi:unnamed protein product [Bemisia tabaci]|uniref:Uncharacterized protein n=1 Tax=Bemisia tabaci TaxID=7038 RepID=A0A9P0AHX1_BEMTA|nr:unnamed protein product [Bemisia tabaci]
MCRHSDSSLSSENSPTPQVKRHYDDKSVVQEVYELVDKGVRVVEQLRSSFSKLRSESGKYSWKEFMDTDNPPLDEVIENQQRPAAMILSGSRGETKATLIA